jgi:Cytochrome P450
MTYTKVTSYLKGLLSLATHGEDRLDGFIYVTYVFSRAMSHDENVYKDPENFIPERFLTEDGKVNPSVRNPMDAAFGFGRRMCPGKHIALASIW